ncbi:hypothetical protein [Streptomyces sp. ST2-7A]|uniref:hypothetical protein n=1 Tax=Streptomyces sp. ST2-7A TaxID=2907214 RepID=UPI001F1AA568|nr:hypothetical protein [Streptomyces sp. ST2-7A]MCE7083553.1 hypothetical protein [Streptomyces sp. ST2-7A]
MPRAPRHTCRRCGARVLITTTQAGRRLAVNEAEDTSGLGNTAVHRDAHGVLRSRRITPGSDPTPRTPPTPDATGAPVTDLTRTKDGEFPLPTTHLARLEKAVWPAVPGFPALRGAGPAPAGHPEENRGKEINLR